MADDFYSLKGFVSYGALANNTYGVTAPIGELSLRSSTFAKDRAQIVGTTDTTPATSSELTVFSSRDVEGDPIAVPAAISSLLVDINNWIYKESVAGTFTSSTESFRTAFNTEFGDQTDDLVVGVMVTNSTIWMPSTITFFLNSNEVFGGTIPAGLESCRIRLWFSNDSFTLQYDEYDIAFIPPVENLDDLFLYPAQVVDLLAQRSPPELTAAVADAAGNSPYTILSSYNFKYYHLGAPQLQTSAYWTFIIWSDYGNNLDTMKVDLADWILAHSTHTREEWIQIFPDIFATTEFIITPLWNQYAIPNLTLENAMYSPVVKWADAKTFQMTTAAGQGYNESHVNGHLTFLSIPYKSIACLCLGGPENRDEKYQFWDFHPAYVNVPTASIDFDRMPSETRFWAMKMFAMLKVAEEMTELSDIPSGMYRLRRTNAASEEILYVAASIYDVQYLVASKKSLNTLHPPVDHSTQPMVILPDPTVTLTTPSGSKHLELNVSATGGTAPYHYAATSGDIEAGGEINPDTGFLNVTFLEFGTNHIDVTVTDARGFPLTATYTVVSTP